MLTIMLVYIAVLFVFEVVCGSSNSVYNPEIGCAAHCDQATRLSPKLFFTQLMPFALFCTVGLYYLGQLSCHLLHVWL
jgi:hypothetical protein